jgi:hypothetical protein
MMDYIKQDIRSWSLLNYPRASRGRSTAGRENSGKIGLP